MKTIKFPEGHWLCGYGFNFELNRVVSYLQNDSGLLMEPYKTYKLGRGIGCVEHETIKAEARIALSKAPEHQKMFILMHKKEVRLYEKLTMTEIDDFCEDTNAPIDQLYVVEVGSHNVKKVNINVTFE